MLSTLGEAIQEIVRTPEGASAVFMFLFGGVLVGGIMLAALSSQSFRDFLREMLFGGVKCKGCKRRIKEWTHWTEIEGEDDYRGWVWCPHCKTKRYEGFTDRVF